MSRTQYAGCQYDSEFEAMCAAIFDWATAGGINDKAVAVEGLTTEDGLAELNESDWLARWDEADAKALVLLDDPVVVEAVQRIMGELT